MKRIYSSKIVAYCLVSLAILFSFTGCDEEDDANIAVTGVTANVDALTLEIGQKDTLTVMIAPSNATVQRYSWESSNRAVADVNNAGVVTGLSKGTANIILKTPRDGYTDTIKVTVLGPVVKVTGVTVDKPTMSVKVNATGQLTANVAPVAATDKSVTWISENTSIATVNGSGLVTGVAVGTTNIVVKTNDGNFTAKSAITVLSADVLVTGVSLNKNKLDLTKGGSEKLTATITPTNATNQKVSWKSDNIAVATVDATGLVTAVGAGTTKITVTTEDGGFTAQADVEVKEATGVAGNYSGTVTMNGTAVGANIALELKYTSETTVSIDTRAVILGGTMTLHVHGDALSVSLADGTYTISGNAITDDFGYGAKTTTVNGTVDASGKIYLDIKITSISEKVEYKGQKK